MRILEGKTLAQAILKLLPKRCAAVKEKRGFAPSLAIINFYPNSPSGIYAKRKIKSCEKIGIQTFLFTPDIKNGYAAFLALLKRLSADTMIDAIMLERPLPKEFDTNQVWELIPANKDVDGLSPLNLGRLFAIKQFSEIEKGAFFVPCTAMAAVRLIQYYNVPLEGANIAIIGRSIIVGKPLAHMLTALNATVTLCHTKTKNLPETLRHSDIIISAAGQAGLIKKDFLPSKAYIIDIATNLGKDGLCGDVAPGAAEHCLALSPVPGGIGPVTKSLLLEAVVRAAEQIK